MLAGLADFSQHRQPVPPPVDKLPIGKNRRGTSVMSAHPHLLKRSRPSLCSGLERIMYLKRKILTSSQMVKMAEIFFGRCFKNALT